jgi:succinoglycan biosynthesis transport protein ExoP
MLMRSASIHQTLDDTDADWSMRDRRAGIENVAEARDPRTFWTILRWRAPLIAALTAATVVAAGIATVVLPPKYKGTTIVLVDPRQPRVTNTEAVLAGIGADAAAVESQVELIESSSLAKRVIARLELDQDPDFASPSTIEHITDSLLSLFGRAPENLAERQISRLVSKFQKGLLVRRRGLTYVLEISYLSNEPAKAARISSAVADAYLEDQRQAKTDMTARASGWLGDRIEEMRERVRASEQAVAAYKSSNNIVDVTQGNKLVSRQMEDLTQQLALARTRSAEARARLERVQQVARRIDDPAALSESLQSQVIANLRSQYTETARVEAEYGALYGSRYPGLVAVRAQLADIRRQIESEIARIVAAIRAEDQVATVRAAALEADLAKLKEQAASFNEANVKLQELEREAQANRSLFEQFLNRAKETTEQQSLQMPEARIVSPALIPLKPDRPSTPLLLLVAAGLGAVLSIGLVLVLERTRRGFRTAGEVEQLLSLPTIGVFPRRPKQGAAAKPGHAAAPGQSKIQAIRAPARRSGLVDPAACFDNGLRAVRARLRQMESRSDGEILVIASALQGEGKSTFACNFAFASASAGTKTLLIDGDIYARSVSRAFGLAGPGLCDIVHGKVPLRQAMKKEPKSGLHVIGAGAASKTSDGIGELDGPDLDSLLRSCRTQFDLVVIDTPAILPMAGLVPFMTCADRAVLIVEWNRTERQAVIEALDALGPDARKIAGVVLNKVAMGWYRLFSDSRYVSYLSYPAEENVRKSLHPVLDSARSEAAS